MSNYVLINTPDNCQHQYFSHHGKKFFEIWGVVNKHSELNGNFSMETVTVRKGEAVKGYHPESYRITKLNKYTEKYGYFLFCRFCGHIKQEDGASETLDKDYIEMQKLSLFKSEPLVKNKKGLEKFDKDKADNLKAYEEWTVVDIDEYLERLGNK